MSDAPLVDFDRKTPPGAEAAVLIVDDDPAIREELSAYLGMYGLKVSCAANGAEVERLLGEQDFNLILLDLWLGTENGFDILSQVRKTSQIPCIMVTAQSEMTDKIVGLELGADDYLTKPVNMRELLARIRALLRRARPQDPGGEGGGEDGGPAPRATQIDGGDEPADSPADDADGLHRRSCQRRSYQRLARGRERYPRSLAERRECGRRGSDRPSARGMASSPSVPADRRQPPR